MTSFLPTDYEVPASTGNYMKFDKGENTFRVLSSAIIGWQGWIVKDGKPAPARFHNDEKPTNLTAFKDGKVSHFWAFTVWNYKTKRIQILEVTQKTIQASMKAFVDNAKWGDPKGYDITISKSGDGLETEYSVMPNPHTKLDAEIEQFVKDTPVNLEALFEGADPFDKDL